MTEQENPYGSHFTDVERVPREEEREEEIDDIFMEQGQDIVRFYVDATGRLVLVIPYYMGILLLSDVKD